MAEAREVALPSGYNDEFVNPVDQDWHCLICHLPLKEAVQTRMCGHRFCRQCLDEHFRRFVVLLIVWAVLSCLCHQIVSLARGYYLLASRDCSCFRKHDEARQCRSCELRGSNKLRWQRLWICKKERLLTLTKWNRSSLLSVLKL